MKGIVKIFAIIFLIFTAIPFSARAISFEDIFDELDDFLSGNENSTRVINEINVSANTGGKKTEGGETIEGEGKTEIEIKNVINGQEIEPIKIETKASEVNITSEIKIDDGVAQLEREINKFDSAASVAKIEIDSEKTTESYEVPLENSQAKINKFDSAASVAKINKFDSAADAAKIGDKGVIEKSLDNIQNWWSDLVEDVKSFLSNILSIF